MDINQGNDATGGDGMNKTDRDDDNANGGGGNSNDDSGVDGNDVFDTKGGDEADDGDGQTESVASDYAECNGSSKLEMRVGVTRWHILKETQC